MPKKEQTSSTYDEMFQDGGHDGIFDLPYRRSSYYPMYKAVLNEIRRFKLESVLEVGCGSGAFAHMLLEKSTVGYRGLDFSRIAVEKAKLRTSKPDLFYVADALDEQNYTDLKSAIVCTEVLEHIPQDLDLVSIWPKGTLCICTVPNFDSPYHVRHFVDQSDVVQRYEELIGFQSIGKIKKPVLSDIGFQNQLRHLRWNRYRPKRLAEILGFGDFEKVGGWYLFSGIRR